MDPGLINLGRAAAVQNHTTLVLELTVMPLLGSRVRSGGRPWGQQPRTRLPDRTHPDWEDLLSGTPRLVERLEDLLSGTPGVLAAVQETSFLRDLVRVRPPRVQTLTQGRVASQEEPYLGMLGDPTVISVFAALGRTAQWGQRTPTHGWTSTSESQFVSCERIVRAPSALCSGSCTSDGGTPQSLP